MTPTAYLRFVWRTEVIDYNPENKTTMGRKVRVLQQFWASPNGASNYAAPGLATIAGEWRDVPLEEQA